MKKYGIYEKAHMENVIYLASGNGHFKPATYENMDDAIKVCNVCNTCESKSKLTKSRYVVAEFDISPRIVTSIIEM